MQLNKMLKELIITLFIIIVTACSFNKNTNNDQREKNITNISTGITDINSPNEQVHLQMKQLQQDNVIYFDLDKYDIRSDFITILNAHANFLRNTPSCKVTVKGHTDERGTPEYNIALGERRAKAVKLYLQAQGVSSDQISIISYGKEKPAVFGHDESSYAKNRRAVLVY